VALPRPLDWVSPPLPEAPATRGSGKPLCLDRVSTADIWWLIGYYFGDGSICDSKMSVSLAMGATDTDIAAKIAAIAKDLGLSAKYSAVERSLPSGYPGRSASSTINSCSLIRWFRLLGIGASNAHEKRLPASVFSLGLSDRISFLSGFFAADGYLKPPDSNPIGLHLCQRALLEDTKLLLHTVGIRSTLRGPYTNKGFTSYRLDVPASDWARISGEIRRHPKGSAIAF
jgi:intein/homing endonuclease